MITEFPAFHGSQKFTFELPSSLPFDIVQGNCNSGHELKAWYLSRIIFLPSHLLVSPLASVGAACSLSPDVTEAL